MNAFSTKLKRQRGVAVITALLLTTLAITIVASLFWQQQVQVRSIENQRLQLQKQWILRGALDWASLILREDLKHTSNDDLTEAWAVPLADTQLDQYVENGRVDNEASEASLSGFIVDAQSRYNVRNLAVHGIVDPAEVIVFGRLLTNLQLSPLLAKATAEVIAAAQPKAQPTLGVPLVDSDASAKQLPMDIEQIDDLLSVPGFTPDILAKLKDFVIVLPRKTSVNANTASAQVLAARIDGFSLAEATALVASRERVAFLDAARFWEQIKKPPNNGISFSTDYFIVNGKVNLSRASLAVQALIERIASGNKIVWIREN